VKHNAAGGGGSRKERPKTTNQLAERLLTNSVKGREERLSVLQDGAGVMMFEDIIRECDQEEREREKRRSFEERKCHHAIRRLIS
jgi:hypothetical protein